MDRLTGGHTNPLTEAEDDKLMKNLNATEDFQRLSKFNSKQRVFSVTNSVDGISPEPNIPKFCVDLNNN